MPTTHSSQLTTQKNVVLRSHPIRTADSCAEQPANVPFPPPRAGLFSAWHVDMVEIYSPGASAAASFPINTWLKPDPTLPNPKDGCRVRRTVGQGPVVVREVVAQKPPEEVPEVVVEMTSYHIEVATWDARGAGTDADVEIKMKGKGG